MSRESVWGHLCVAWFAILFTFAFALHGCGAADELAAARTANNAAATAISDESARILFATKIDAQMRKAACAPADDACRVAAGKAAAAADMDAVLAINRIAQIQRLLATALDMATACKTKGDVCYRTFADQALALAAQLEAARAAFAATATADAGVDGAP